MATSPFENEPTRTNLTDVDQAAQQHPEGNVPGHIRSPKMGLPVNDGHPSGEQNGEERKTDARMQEA